VSAENETLARRYFEQVCNERRLDVADEILAPDHRYHDPQSPPELGGGAESMKQTIGIYQDALEGRWEVHEIVACGDRVTTRWTGHGRHVREIMGLPPTGREVRVDALTLMRVEGGRIAETWTTWDTLGMLQQLGAVPAPDGDAAILGRAYEAFARGDVPAVLEAPADDISWYSPDELPTGGRYDGVAGVVGFFDTLRRSFDELSVEPREFVDAGAGRIVVCGRHRGRLHGEPFDVGFAHVWTMHEGKAASFREYMDSGKLVPLFERATTA
jgi:steroid delta-isomerase-like uncharacterized protein